ncbi:MAG: putative toxin-antitoxin system toxin component, PIN family [Sphingobacteriales bacterium]|nr:MAG: putative toxin-antitoxin system toxin component, PIN family [Sphingobacteriales bacterium]
MKIQKVVFDTNIWVSYIIKARLTDLTRLILDNDLTIYRSEKLTQELTEVISRKKFSGYLSLPIINYISFYKSLTKNIKPKIVYGNSPDPNDNFLFELAIAAKATHIVTGDKILSALGTV